MPALIGIDRLRDKFGDIEWEKHNLTMSFSHFKQELQVEVNFNGYIPIFLFRSEKEIDDYLDLLRTVLL